MARDLTKLKNAIATIKQNSTQERYLDIGYTRVSSELTAQDTSIQRQIEDFTDVGCNLIIVERESGASAEKRSLYQAIIQEILDGTVIRVAATINSRINRNQTESEYFYRLCQMQEVKINILDEPELNSNSLSAQKIRREKAFYAEMESKVMGFRQKKANIRAEKNLKAIARKPIFGYRFTPERKYEVDWAKPDLSNVLGWRSDRPFATGELARTLIDLYLEFESQSQAFKRYKDLLRQLKPANPDLIEREIQKTLSWFGHWLKDPILRGAIAYGKYKEVYVGEKLEKIKKIRAPKEEWRIHRGQHEALITPAEDTLIATILKNNLNRGYRAYSAKCDFKTPKTLGRIMRCCGCGQVYNSQSTNQKGNKYRFYYCVGRKEYRCNAPGIGEKTFVDRLIVAIINKAEELADILNDAELGTTTPDTERLTFLRSEAAVAFAKYKQYGFEEYLDLHRKFQQQITDIEANMQQTKSNLEEREQLILALSNPQFWQEMSRYDLHRYLREIVARAWIEDKQIVRVELNL